MILDDVPYNLGNVERQKKTFLEIKLNHNKYTEQIFAKETQQ